MKKISIIITLVSFFITTVSTTGQERTKSSLEDLINLENSTANTDISLTSGISSLGYDNPIIFQEDQEDIKKERRRARRRFDAHWAGFEIGLNNFLSSDYSASLPPELNWLDLHTGKSFNYNFNVAQLGLGFTRHIGLLTGIGFEFNNYRFENNNNITKDSLGVIIPYYPPSGVVFEKSKLFTMYFTMPLMLEFQIPVKYHSSINIAAGMIAGVKLASHNKMKYNDGGKRKIKEKDDFSLNVVRYGPTARVGYECFNVYFTYYMNGLFKENKGPVVYPVQLGVAFTFND